MEDLGFGEGNIFNNWDYYLADFVIEVVTFDFSSFFFCCVTQYFYHYIWLNDILPRDTCNLYDLILHVTLHINILIYLQNSLSFSIFRSSSTTKMLYFGEKLKNKSN